MLFRKYIYKLLHWETWPYLVKYIPLAPVWGWYCLRSGILWFFTTSNPTLCFGGFEGETKMEMYNQLPSGTYPLTILINHQCIVEELVSAFARSGLQFPVAVKPDAGMMGFMFRRLQDEEQLINYHSLIPSDYLIQDLVDYPLEVSVFYYRYPGRQTGTYKRLLLWPV